GDALPRPGFADETDGRLRRNRQVDAVNRLDRPAVNVELGVEVFYPEEVAHRCRGSSASRIPSPTRLMASAVMTSAVAGKITRYVWSESRYCSKSLSMLPQLGSGGGLL